MAGIQDKTALKMLAKNELLALNLFWLGFIMYIASDSLTQPDKVSYVLGNILQLFGLCLMLPSSIYLVKMKIDHNYLRVLFIIYWIWLMVLIIRSITFEYWFLKRMLFHTNAGIFLYLTPIVMLFPRNIYYYKRLFDVIVVFGILYVLYDIIFHNIVLGNTNYILGRGVIENFSQQLSFPSGFLLLTYLYHSGKRTLFGLFTVMLTFLLAVIQARRGLMFMSFTMLLFFFIIYQAVNKTNIIRIFFSVSFILIATYIAIHIYDANRKDTFALITERISLQTRGEVEQYFYSDLKTKDWIIGKGINGQYFCPGVEEGLGRPSIFRTVIETGYLQIILNGGIINLILFLLIMIPALVKGLFFSRNLLSKAAAIWIILFLLYLYPGTPTYFSLYYILVWISIGICYSPEVRRLSDKAILRILKPENASI